MLTPQNHGDTTTVAPIFVSLTTPWGRLTGPQIELATRAEERIQLVDPASQLQRAVLLENC